MQLKEFILKRRHRTFRRDHPELDGLAERFAREGLSPLERMARRFELLTSLETPVLLPGEQICFLRTVKEVPDCFTAQEWAAIRKTHFIHESGYLSNLSPDYERVIAVGLEALRSSADSYGRRAIDAILDPVYDGFAAIGRTDKFIPPRPSGGSTASKWSS